MASTFSITHFKTLDKHQANIQASLNHRLEVARASHNSQLVSLIEQERRQMESDLQIDIDGSNSAIDRLKLLWGKLVETIVHANDLQVWTRSYDGNALWWHAYNPRTGKSVITDSESEMRIWIEANYWEE
jgi:hypothetical protein